MVSRYYHIPSLTFVASAHPSLATMPRHGPWPWHQLIADWIAACWRRHAEAACNATTDAAAAAPPDDGWELRSGAGAVFVGPAFPPDPWIHHDHGEDGAANDLEPGEGGKEEGPEDPRLHHHRHHHRDLGRGNLPPPIAELASEGAELCLYPSTAIRADRPALVPEPARSGVNSSSGGWALGEDSPGNGKMALWADAPAGGAIEFTVSLRLPHPLIGLGFLTSYDPAMGKVRVTLDGEPARGVVFDGFDNSSRVSVLRYMKVCVDADAGGGAAGTLPACDSKPDDAPAERGRGGNGKGYKAVTQTQKRRLRIELIGRPGTPRNKFALRYITAC